MNSKDVLVGAGVGAALAFMLDPERGARRRALARDKFVWGSRKTREGLDATARDMANRARGTAAAVQSRVSCEEIDDVRLVERVRAKLGRVCSHPRAVDVEAHDGEITLRGPILATEVNRVLATISAVRGVGSVTNALEPHESAEHIPALQGNGRVAGPTLDILQRNWAPATQALVAAAGIAAAGMLVAYARR
jgi:gas vesicle protein